MSGTKMTTPFRKKRTPELKKKKKKKKKKLKKVFINKLK